MAQRKAYITKKSKNEMEIDRLSAEVLSQSTLLKEQSFNLSLYKKTLDEILSLLRGSAALGTKGVVPTLNDLEYSVNKLSTWKEKMVDTTEEIEEWKEEIHETVNKINSWKDKIEDNRGKIIIKIDSIGAKFMWLATILGIIAGTLLTIKQIRESDGKVKKAEQVIEDKRQEDLIK